MKKITQKFDGYRRRVRYEWNQWRNAAVARKREKMFGEWLAFLTANPPDVLVGANFATYGGVRHHIQAIQRYSTLNVELAPSEKLMREIGAHHITHDFRDWFARFPAEGVKVVHSHVYPWFIEWCCEHQKTGTHWIHTYHLHYYTEHGTQGLKLWQKEINDALLNVASRADICLSVSQWQAKELMREHGIKAQYLPNGVDVAICDAASASRFIDKMGIDKFILYVGRNDPVKNPLDFVRLAERLPDYQFVMIGGGLSDESLRCDWHVEVPDNLLIVGPISHTEVQDAIAACSALVVTSKREGLPTLVMEGMAQCKAVVVPNEAGCMEVIGAGEAGIIYEQGDIDDLKEKTLKALVDTELGKLARRRVLVEYDWQNIAPKLDAIYQGIST